MNLLSICIPTYNRKERLKKLLSKICKMKPKNIDIIVIDNASTDGTKDMMEYFEKTFGVVYLRNNSNLGHDGNFVRLIEEGRKYSVYSLWLGDDDCIDKDFFRDIPQLLTQNTPNIMVLNSRYYTNNMFKKIICSLKLKKKPIILDIREDCIESNIIDFFKKYFDKLPFGTIIVNNNLLDINSAMKYIGTYHLYGGAIWEMLSEFNSNHGYVKVYITSKAYVIWGNGNKTYKNIMQKVYVGMGMFFAVLPKVLSDEVNYIMLNMNEKRKFGEYTDIVWKSYIENVKNAN